MGTRGLRDALEDLAGTGDVPPDVRPEIAESWARALNRGLEPDRFDVPFVADPDTESAPMRAASSVLRTLAQDLRETPVGILLTDSTGRVVSRWASGRRIRADLDRISLAPGYAYGETVIGTNAIGSALQREMPSFVSGQEHFADVLTRMACGAAPFFDPLTGDVLGVVDLTCRADDASPLLLTLARRTAREVADLLGRETTGGDQYLWQQFLRLRRNATGPFAVVNHRQVFSNAAAGTLISPADTATLWESASRAFAGGKDGPTFVRLDSGVEVDIVCEPLWGAGELIGAAIRLRPMRVVGSGSVLTATESSVASLVTEGLTNRQVGERLFMSRFTVDSHLRSIYRKFGVASRVQLVRAMTDAIGA